MRTPEEGKQDVRDAEMLRIACERIRREHDARINVFGPVIIRNDVSLSDAMRIRIEADIVWQRKCAASCMQMAEELEALLGGAIGEHRT